MKLVKFKTSFVSYDFNIGPINLINQDPDLKFGKSDRLQHWNTSKY